MSDAMVISEVNLDDVPMIRAIRPALCTHCANPHFVMIDENGRALAHMMLGPGARDAFIALVRDTCDLFSANAADGKH